MGKVLKAVAVIAIAVAVAYFAPQLLPALIGSGALASAVAAAIVSTAIATAVTTGLSLLAGKPHTSTAPGAQSTRGQPQERDGFAWRYPPPPAQSEMAAVGHPRLGASGICSGGHRKACRTAERQPLRSGGSRLTPCPAFYWKTPKKGGAFPQETRLWLKRQIYSPAYPR